MSQSHEPRINLLVELKQAYVRHGCTLRNSGFWIVANYHLGRWSETLPQPARLIASKVHGAAMIATELLAHTVLYRETQVGKELHFVHGECIRISPHAILGDRVGICHGVTIGTSPDRPGAPVIGDDVLIGVGAAILGPVKVGNGATIAANSLVISDVPDNATAIGVPARVMVYGHHEHATAK